ELKRIKADDICELLTERAMKLYHSKEELFGEEKFREIERAVLLRNVDTQWMNHIDEMEDLKGGIGLQAYAQRDPVNEYRLLGADLFDAMVSEIREQTVRMILSIFPRVEPVTRVEVAKPLVEGFAGGQVPPRAPGGASPAVRPASAGTAGTPIVRQTPKVGRNDPCPCGSGKKYKKCCGASSAENNEE
ncbi:MAG: SEC-C domain-containing protein, partial [Clostridia bacterium]|nr:SEC-C domain-containing protein [Clostridia bacterium]